MTTTNILNPPLDPLLDPLHKAIVFLILLKKFRFFFGKTIVEIKINKIHHHLFFFIIYKESISIMMMLIYF